MQIHALAKTELLHFLVWQRVPPWPGGRAHCKRTNSADTMGILPASPAKGGTLCRPKFELSFVLANAWICALGDGHGQGETQGVCVLPIGEIHVLTWAHWCDFDFWLILRCRDRGFGNHIGDASSVDDLK